MMRTIGTPGFIAPELCCTRPDVIDLKTLQQVDIWSLGVTLYCLVFAALRLKCETANQTKPRVANRGVYGLSPQPQALIDGTGPFEVW